MPNLTMRNVRPFRGQGQTVIEEMKIRVKVFGCSGKKTGTAGTEWQVQPQRLAMDVVETAESIESLQMGSAFNVIFEAIN